MTIYPAKKPARTPRKPKKPLPPATKRPRARNKKRHSREWIRAYGSVERVEFIKALPDVVLGDTPCDNVHVESGGMGRKADYAKIVPLTHRHHTELHQYGIHVFEWMYGIDLEKAAADTEAAWLSHSKNKDAAA